jgi:predicted nucleic acid-binding protein
MIVLDASVLVDFLLDVVPHGNAIARRIHGEALVAPHLVDVEVAQAIRRYVRSGEIDAGKAESALDDLCDLSLVRYPHAPLLRRCFELRNNVTMYDALYLVLAESLGIAVVTRDRALARIPGHRAKVEVLG